MSFSLRSMLQTEFSTKAEVQQGFKSMFLNFIYITLIYQAAYNRVISDIKYSNTKPTLLSQVSLIFHPLL